MKTPVLPKSFRSVTGLGAVEQIYPPRSRLWSAWVCGILTLTGMGGAGYFAITGILSAVDRYYRLGPAVLGKTLLFPLAMAVLFLLVGLTAGAMGWQHSLNWAVLYAGGAAVQTPARLDVWRWEDFQAVQISLTRQTILGIPMGIRRSYRYTSTRGEILALDDRWQAVNDLAEEIRLRTAPLIYARCVGALRRGETLSLGGVSISSSGGIELDHQPVGWEDLESVSVERGMVKIKTRSQNELRVGAAAIQNLDVFLSLADQKIADSGNKTTQSR
ncbi:MAG: DUF6585 family protein [Anaerolineaceae bacterium]